MIRIVTIAAWALFMSACSGVPDWAAGPRVLNTHAGADVGHYRFDWKLSGDQQVAPLQIFDNGNQTWLQFLPGQVAPAIFERTRQGERPLSYVRQGDYLVLEGVRAELLFRGGMLSARARKNGTHDVDLVAGQEPVADAEPAADTGLVAGVEPVADTGPVADAEPVALAVSAPPPNISPTQPGVQHDVPNERLDAGFDVGSEDGLNVGLYRSLEEGSDARPGERQDDAFVNADAGQLTRASFESITTATSPDFHIGVQDRNLREALHRWAAQAGWTFAPEHWDVDVDISISGEAGFYGTFQDAVQDVLSSTELAERPLRPCFYSNQVLRVVSYTQSCDRSAGRTS